MAELKARNRAMESVTAMELRNVTAKLPKEDAELFGLYGGEAVVLRVGEKVYPFLFSWIYLQYAPELYSGDFDGDGMMEYAILRRSDWGTMNADDYYRKDELYILEILDEEVKVHLYDETSRGRQLEKILSAQYFEKNSGEGSCERNLTVTAAAGEGGETSCTVSLSEIDEILQAHSFQSIGFGSVEEFRLMDGKWYYFALGGIQCEGLYVMHYECGVQLSGQVEYQDGGAFALRNIELWNR